MLNQGKDLIAGQRATCVSSIEGIVSNSPEYLVLNQRDKKGNVQLVNINTGDVVTASALSVWDSWSNVPPSACVGPR
jgi:hypothetical protein